MKWKGCEMYRETSFISNRLCKLRFARANLRFARANLSFHNRLLIKEVLLYVLS